MNQIVDLLKMVFGESLDIDDRQLLAPSGPGAVDDLINLFSPLSRRLTNGFVWQADGRVVANATLLTTREWDRYLVANVAVHPSYRRRGIARALMQAITSAVQARGGRVILLQVVKDNRPALELYRSLGYSTIGNMATWYVTVSRMRQIATSVIDDDERGPQILPLAGRRWREAYELDTGNVPADLNWPEPLRPDAYRRTFWQRSTDFLNGRQIETWSTTDSEDRLTGLANIASEWGRNHLISLRVRPDWAGRLERSLMAKILRRLQYLPRRSVRIDHPEDDIVTSELLREANFSVQRTLTHMRLDLSK
jgi:ribosomal protein S18 acetylase RimI-like enzyme